MKKTNPTFVLANPPGELLIAHAVIQKVLNKNGIALKHPLTIKLDFSLPDDVGGCYYYKDDKFSIVIDPAKSNDFDETYFGRLNEELCYSGYVSDMTMIGVCLHEFAHFMCYQMFPTLTKDYTEKFPKDRLYLNEYSNTGVEEELAEIIRLYITNPLFLKLIDKSVFNFLKQYFDPPYNCSHKFSYEFYQDFPEIIKDELRARWNIIYNVKTKKFERIDSDGAKRIGPADRTANCRKGRRAGAGVTAR
jgi:hypothetical protein